MKYTARFEAMWPFIKTWEGTVFENDPDDPGGATKFGIDQRSHPKENIRELTEERAKEIYWQSYWTANKCDAFPYPLGECVFNCAVNCGSGRVDAIFKAGAKTADSFLDEQAAFYRRLAVAKPRMQKYLKGWLNRVNALRKHLKL